MKITTKQQLPVDKLEDRIAALRMPSEDEGGISWMVDFNVGDRTVRATAEEWNEILDLALQQIRSRIGNKDSS